MRKKSILIKLLCTFVITAIITSTSYGLAPPSSLQDPLERRRIFAELHRRGRLLRIADSPDEIALLEANNASCLLLSSGKYLISEEVARNTLELCKSIIHEDIEAVMQILAEGILSSQDRYKYQAIKELVLKFFPPSEDSDLPINLYVNHTVARIFQWKLLLDKELMREEEIPPTERHFVVAVEESRMLNKRSAHFTAEFWNPVARGKAIQKARNKGMRFYQVAGSQKGEKQEDSSRPSGSYTILELIDQGYFSTTNAERKNRKSNLKRGFFGKDGELVIFDSLVHSDLRDVDFTIEDIVNLVGQDHYMELFPEPNHAYREIKKVNVDSIIKDVRRTDLLEKSGGKYRIMEKLKLCPDIETIIRIGHDPYLESLYIYDENIRIESEHLYFELMKPESIRGYLVDALSKVTVEEPAIADDVMEFILNMRNSLVGRKGDKDRCVDDNLIKTLPDIAGTLPDARDFLDALFIELKLFKAVSEERKIFEYEGYCQDYGSFQGGEYSARVISEPVFSFYKNLFSDAKKLKDFVRSLAIDLRENPSLVEELTNKEDLCIYLLRKHPKIVQIGNIMVKRSVTCENIDEWRNILKNKGAVIIDEVITGHLGYDSYLVPIEEWDIYYKYKDETEDKTEPKAMKKCLVLDCDGVLWGGIVGEDGIEGIQLTPAHLAFQKKVKELKEKGVILAINSKNNPEDVERVLEERSDMVLRKSDFAAMRVNWQDKASNMRELAEELNIGTDSFVFLDDSPQERQLVSMSCPEVLTPDLPENPEEREAFLGDLDVFSKESVTEEDKRRTEFYAAREERRKARTKAKSLEEFYRELGMLVVIREGEENRNYIPRIAQLTQRTNQFNLTLKRYTEADIERFITVPPDKYARKPYRVYSLELIDKFGNSGVVGVIILDETDPGKPKVDTFCLSCRAIGLTIEEASLAYVLPHGGLKGIYIKGERNALVERLYPALGFKRVKDEGSTVVWESDPDRKITSPEWIDVLSWKDYRDGYNEARSKEVEGMLKSFESLNNQELAKQLLILAKEKGLKDSILRQTIRDISTLLKNSEVQRKALELELAYLGLDEKVLSAEGKGLRKETFSCSEFRDVLKRLIGEGKEILSTEVIDDDYEAGDTHWTETHEVIYIESENVRVKKAAVPLFPYFRMRTSEVEKWVAMTHELCIECGLFNLLEPRKLAGGYAPGRTFRSPEDDSPLSPWHGYHKSHSVLNMDLEGILKDYVERPDSKWTEYIKTWKKYRDSMPKSVPRSKGHPAFAFENMPEGRFTYIQYCEKTDVPRSTAIRDFNVLEELGLATIHRGSGGKPNEITCTVPEDLKPTISQILSTYQDKRDIPKIAERIRVARNKGMRFYQVASDERDASSKFKKYKGVRKQRIFFNKLLLKETEGPNRISALKSIAAIIRLYSLYMCKYRGSHLGSSFSLADIISTLYAGKLLDFSIANNKLTDIKESDQLFLSGGHSIPAFYVMYHMLGLLDAQDLISLRLRGGMPGHPESRLTPNTVFISSGSLGQGLSEAAGAALVSPERKVYVIIGDGELQEGNIQEAIQYVGRTSLDNLIAFVDYNKIQLSYAVSEHKIDLSTIAMNFSSNGWNVIAVDGHDLESIENAIKSAQEHLGSPTVIIADTLIGKGISFMEQATYENRSDFHAGQSSLDDTSFDKAARELLRQIKEALDVIDEKLFPRFQELCLKPENFGAVLSGVKQSKGESTQEAFIRYLCDLIEKDDLPLAYLIADLSRSSVMGERIDKAINDKKRQNPNYRGIFADVGIRELFASTMLKGIARASEKRNDMGETLYQDIVPIFSCYAAMINLATEPLRMAAQDNLQFILNIAQLGFLSEMGGNSHNTGVIGVGNFIPIFVPSTTYETGYILKAAVERILRGDNGRCGIATSRFRISEQFFDKKDIDEIYALVKDKYEKENVFDNGVYILGENWESGEVKATIVTSGPMLYSAYSAKKALEKKGIKVRLINVVKFSRQFNETLSHELSKLLPTDGPVFTIWDGDRNVLHDRVATAIATRKESKIYCVPLGPTEESDANGTVFEVMEALELRPQDIVSRIANYLSAKNLPHGHPAFAFENMPEGRFTYAQYCEKTDVPRSTAIRDFNVLEELGLVTIHRGSGGKANKIVSALPEGVDKGDIIRMLSEYRDTRDIPRIAERMRELPHGQKSKRTGYQRTLKTINIGKQELTVVDEEKINLDLIKPPAIIKPKLEEKIQIENLAEGAISEGTVGLITVAGGMASRAGLSYPKGMYPIMPLSHKTFFETRAEELIAVRNHYGVSIPWFIMTSKFTDEVTREYFSENNYFGLDKENVIFIKQENVPTFETGSQKPAMQSKNRALTMPNGHGGIYNAMRDAQARTDGGKISALEEAGRRNVNTFLYCQVDNPLPVVNKKVLGYHLKHRSDFTTVLVRKRDPEEGLAMLAADSKTGYRFFVEYNQPVAEIIRNKEGYEYGSTALFIFSYDFLANAVQPPYRIASNKKAKIFKDGRIQDGLIDKFESFSFDALFQAKISINIVLPRGECFAPFKRMEGYGSPETATKGISDYWKDLIRQACPDIEILESTVIELPWSANYMTPEQLREKLSAIHFSSRLKKNVGLLVSPDFTDIAVIEGQKKSTKKGHPAFAFGHMPEGKFTLTQYWQETGVPRSTARSDFDVLEELGLVKIAKGKGRRSNVIECAVLRVFREDVLRILRTYRDKRDIPRVKSELSSTLYDTEFTTVLMLDLLDAPLHEDRIYEIAFDTARLSQSQIDIIETYINFLKKKTVNPNNIKKRCFSSKKSRKKRPLIKVSCTGKDFEGKGCVDVDIPDGNIADYLLRITGMLNIALAASNIPDRNVTDEEIKTEYGPLIGFIQNQYKVILGTDFEAPYSAEELLEKIKNLVLTLPSMHRMDPDKITEYNRLCRKTLLSV